MTDREPATPIAVIGIGCRFPGDAETADAYWALLRDGVDATREIPEERWDVDYMYDPEPGTVGKAYTKRGGFFQRSAKEFDAAFFGISPHQASYMDPQQRMNLEVAWQAMEDAALAPEALEGTNTGVFIGATASSYQHLADNTPDLASAHSILGIHPGSNAGFISHHLHLRGPCVGVDTACSSSLVAVHQACESLRHGESDLAFAGGANTLVDPALFLSFCQAQMLSPDGRCKTFDARADGYARGEGCGIVILKRLDDAVADGDRILGVLRGSAVNHGSGHAITAPTGPAQQAVFQAALERAGIGPAEVSYVEAHGTGTPLGDPVEMHAVKAVYGVPRERPLLVGSAKTNVGHLEVAAGMAGLIKVLLAMRHGQIPPHLHFEEWNPQIDREGFDVAIPTELTDWPSEGPRFAAVSSFGFQGTNAHVLVEEPPAPQAAASATVAERPLHLLALSGKSEAAVRELAGRHADSLADETLALGDYCHTAHVGRAHFERRAFALGSSREALRAALGRIQAGEAQVGTRPRGEPSVPFLFTGQGSQHAGMGRRLYETLPVFREALDACAGLLGDEGLIEHPLFEVLWGEHQGLLDETAYTQPALFSLQRALYATWTSWGIEPAAVSGHSIGEYMAAVAAGALSWQDGLRLVAARGRLMQALDRHAGAMGAVGADENAVQATLARLGVGDRVGLAAVNGPASVVISGARGAVDEVLAAFEAQDVRTRRLAVSHAFHSHLMEPMLEAFDAAAREAAWGEARIAFVSTVTGTAIEPDELASPAYWVRQIRQPVRYRDALRSLLDAGHRHFVELGPKPHLSAMAQGCLTPEEHDECLFVASLRGPAPAGESPDDWPSMLDGLGQLYAHAGALPAWEGLDRGFPARRRIAVPTYPFQRKPFWHPRPEGADRRTRSELTGLVGERVPVAGIRARIYDGPLRASAPAYLADHVVAGAPLLPGAGFMEMALSATRRAIGAGDDIALGLREVGFTRMLPLSEAARVGRVTLEPRGQGYGFRVLSCAPGAVDAEDGWAEHAAGEVRALPAAEPREEDVASLYKRMDPKATTKAAIYERLAELGLEYGPEFRGLAQVWRGDRQALGRVDLSVLKRTADEHYAYPALLDACFHVVAAAVDQGGGVDPYLPVRVESATFAGPLGAGPFWAHASLRGQPGPRQPLVADLTIYSRRGTEKARIEGLVLAPVAKAKLASLLGAEVEEDPSTRWVQHVHWTPQARVEEAHMVHDERWLVLGSSPVAQATVAYLAMQSLRVGPCTPDGLREQLDAIAGSGSERVYVLDVLDEESQPAARAFDLARTVARFAAEHPEVRVTVATVTRGAQAVDPGIEPGAPEHAATWALARVGARELPDIEWRAVDLDPIPRDPSDEADELYHEVAAGTAEPEVAFRGAQRLVRRLAPAQAGRSASLDRPALAAGPLRLGFTTRGSIDHLRLRESQPKTQLDPGWVRVRVQAAGLNFRDVMNVLGTYPGDPGPMGLECAGEVVDVGEGVTGFAPGDRVVGLASGCFDGEVAVPSPLLVKLPESISCEEGATLSVTFLTAHYALNRLAEVQEGERVLIHAGTGGVGMAAIQLAQRAGAEVFATASDGKRHLLRAMGVAHAFDSRSQDYHDQILEVTGGEGIDVALNSLAGEYIPNTVALLREGGRYLEIGKTGIWTEEQIAAHNPEARGFTIALDDLAAERPAYVGEMLQEIVGWVAEGELRPLPVTEFPLEGARRAFRYMIKARHTGKIVLTGFQPGPLCRSDGTYVVAGGLGGLGLETAQWLRRQGAGKLVLLGRSAPGEAAQAVIDELAAAGATVQAASVDVTDREAVASLLDRLRAEGPPIRGIVHAAGVLDDGFLARQTWERVQAVAAPKILGARHLDALTRDDPLDFFVLYSSMASMLGNAGQSGYALGNAYLDALAHQRRARGRTALSVNWGPWSEVGMAARMDERLQEQQARVGIGSIDPRRGFEALTDALERDEIEVAVLPIEWPTYLEAFFGSDPPSLYAEVLSEGPGEAGDDGPASAEMDPELRALLLAAETPEARREAWRSFLQAEVAHLLGMEADVSAIEPGASLQELGVDSLVGMELLKRFNAKLGEGNRVSAAVLFQYGSIDALAGYLESHVTVDVGERAA